MSLNLNMKFLFYSLVVGVLIFTGCGQKGSEELALKALSTPEDAIQEEEASEPAPLDEVINLAEAYYDEGCEHYKHHRWALAQQAFDQALEILLDADVDAETHYKLSRTYDRLFYKIHKLESEQTYLASLTEEVQEEAESTDQLEAFLSFM